MTSGTSWIRTTREKIFGEELEFYSDCSPEDCKRVLSARTTRPLGSTLTRDSPSLFGDDWRRVERLRSEGILLQGRIRSWAFDVYCLEKLTGLRGNLWRPHFVGRFEARSNGTTVVGDVGVSALAKVGTLVWCLLTLFFTLLGVVTGFAPLAIGGACFLVFGCILVPAFCLFMARDEWQELPDTLREVFPGT